MGTQIIPKTQTDKVISVLSSSPKSESQIAEETEMKPSRVETICRDLKNKGIIKTMKIEVAEKSYVRGWILCLIQTE